MSSANSNIQSAKDNNGKWALNVQDIIKRTHQNMIHRNNEYGNQDRMRHQLSGSSEFQNEVKTPISSQNKNSKKLNTI